METCVLLPPQLAVVLVFHPDPYHIFEMRATLMTNTTLTAGTIFHPHQGQFTLDRLNVYNKLHTQNKLHEFGCCDEITEIEGRDVRHCNWIRFIRVSLDPAEVNVIGSKVDGQPMFKICKDLCANTELVALLEDNITADTTTTTQSRDLITEMKESHIDVTGDSDCEETVDSTPFCYDRSVAISPISRDDDAFSSGSEDAGAAVRYNIRPSSRDIDSNLRLQTSEKNDSGALDLSWSPTSRETRNKQSVVSSSTCLLPPNNMIVTSSSVMTPPVRRRERSWLPCDVCGKKFDRPSLLKRHMRTHTGEKPHACDVCGKAFSTSSSLNTHRRIHSGEKPHQCNVCGKRFTASSNLYYHRMTHNKDKPHKCGMCSKSFPTPGDLRSHQYVHSGSWPHKCDVCHRGFSKLTSLNNHRLLHKDEATFASSLTAPHHRSTQDRIAIAVPSPNCASSPVHEFRSSPYPLKSHPAHAYEHLTRPRDMMQAYHNLQAYYNTPWCTSHH